MILVVLSGFILGTILGSFVKAIADRSIENVSYLGRSYCQSCKKDLKWYDLFPIVSFLILKGKCRYCKKRIPLDNFITEVVMGLMVALLFAETFTFGFEPLVNLNLSNAHFLLTVVFELFIIAVLAIIFIVDSKTYIIPDRVIFPSTFIAGIYLFTSSLFRSWTYYQDLLSVPIGKYLLPPYSNYLLDNLQRIWMHAFWSVVSGLGAAGVFILLIILTRGRGMGWGDVKYVFFLGLVLGFPQIVVALFLAFLLGAVFSLVLIVFRKKHFGQTIPFGPFLSLSAFITLIWGYELYNFYINFSLGG